MEIYIQNTYESHNKQIGFLLEESASELTQGRRGRHFETANPTGVWILTRS